MRLSPETPGFVLVAYAFLVTMVGTTLPTPLYPLFEQRYSFGELMVTVIFAVYAFGVIAGLLAFGNLSDEIGRKPVLLVGLAFSVSSALLFLFAGSLDADLRWAGSPRASPRASSRGRRRRCSSTLRRAAEQAARELRRRDRQPRRPRPRDAARGPPRRLLRSPLRLPFIVQLGLLVPAFIGLLLTPETVERRAFRFSFQRLKIPAEVRSVFIRGAAAGFASFAVAGVFSSVAPVFLGQILGRTSHALAGLIVFILFSCSILGQLLVSRFSDRRALVVGCALLAGGVGLLALALGSSRWLR